MRRFRMFRKQLYYCWLGIKAIRTQNDRQWMKFLYLTASLVSEVSFPNIYEYNKCKSWGYHLWQSGERDMQSQHPLFQKKPEICPESPTGLRPGREWGNNTKRAGKRTVKLCHVYEGCVTTDVSNKYLCTSGGVTTVMSFEVATMTGQHSLTRESEVREREWRIWPSCTIFWSQNPTMTQVVRLRGKLHCWLAKPSRPLASNSCTSALVLTR